MPRRRLRSTLLGFCLSILVAVIIAAWPGTTTFTVGPETTYVTEPLDKHGYVDYVTALNQRIGRGITPDKNANVLLWQAVGPHPEGGTMPAEYFQWLGAEAPPEAGEYWTSLRTYLKERAKEQGKPAPDPEADRAIDQPFTPARFKDAPELAEWLGRNKPPLDLLLKAAERPEYYNPYVPIRTEDSSAGLLASLLPVLQGCREMANALVWRAMLAIDQGKIDDAWRDLLACHRLGRLIGRGAGMVELLVAIAIDGIATKGDIAFLGYAKLTSRQDLACLADLRRLPPLPAIADKVDRGERFMMLDTIMLTARHGPKFLEYMSNPKKQPPGNNRFTARLFTRSINWDPAFRNANRQYDRYVSALRIPDRSERRQELSTIIDEVKALGDQAKYTGWLETQFMGPEARGERIGNILIRLLMPGIEKIQDSAERIEQDHRNLQIAFALAAYRQDQGRYPANLEDLVPKYLKQVPNDLFSDGPLRYSWENNGYLLYSVGLNGVDEEGRSYDDHPRGDDLSVRMPPRAPEKRP